MRAVWWREQRELLVPALAVLVAMAFLGAEFARDGIREEGLAILGLIGGGFGLFQGLLDRARRTDGFLLHRPIFAMRIHVARSFAGVTTLAFGVAAAVAGGAWWHWREHIRAREQGYDRVIYTGSMPLDWFSRRLGFGLGAVALALACLVGGYVVVRYSTSRRRIPVAIFAAFALGIAGWSLVARCSDLGAAAGTAIAFAGVVFTLLMLDLAGDRR
jgi:hypothetical protein